MVQIASIFSMGFSRAVFTFSRRKKLFMTYQPRIKPLTNRSEYHLNCNQPMCKIVGSIFQCTTKYSIVHILYMNWGITNQSSVVI